MSNEFADISWVGLAWSAGLVAIAMAVSRLQRLKLETRLLIGSVRTVIQLIAIGYVLGWIIQSSDNHPWLVILAALFQLAMAALSANSLLQPRLKGGLLIAILSIVPAYLLIIAILLCVIIQPVPYWNARIVLPLGGMLLGNTITGVALALNRYRSDLIANRDLILARLALGVDRHAGRAQQLNAARRPRQPYCPPSPRCIPSVSWPCPA